MAFLVSVNQVLRAFLNVCHFVLRLNALNPLERQILWVLLSEKAKLALFFSEVQPNFADFEAKLGHYFVTEK